MLSGDASESKWRLELSRSVKENHGEEILKISVPPSLLSFCNVVAVLSPHQVNIYDTDNLEQGHVDLVSHYVLDSEDSTSFIDCCWLANDSDGYLAILLSNGNIQLLSLSNSAIISNIALPSSIHLSNIFADITDGERLYGIDVKSDTLHLFSYDASVNSPLLNHQSLDSSRFFECDGQLLEVTGDERKMRPFLSDTGSDEMLLELAEGKISFTSIRGNDYLIIDEFGRIFHFDSPSTPAVVSKYWSRRRAVAHDGDSLLAFVFAENDLILFDLDRNESSRLRGAGSSGRNQNKLTCCTFLTESNCCSQGRVRRLMVADDSGHLTVYRIM